MSEQNYKNHSRLVPGFHYLGYLLLAVIIGGSIINMKYTWDTDGCMYSPVLIGIAGLLFLLVMLYSRSFALTAQDRAIRAEENFRHFIATGKPHDNRLRMGQIIALRFAGDDEFVALCKRAADENMSGKEIKMAIRNWRADNYRV